MDVELLDRLSVRSPCSWAGFPGFWFVFGPTQEKYAGPVWVGFAWAAIGLNNMLGWVGLTGFTGCNAASV